MDRGFVGGVTCLVNSVSVCKEIKKREKKRREKMKIEIEIALVVNILALE